MTKAAIAMFLAAAAMAGAPSAPSPALEGIAHAAFRVADVGKAREFYKTLGFEEAFSFADPGKAPVSYIKINDRQFVELYGRIADSQPLGLMHLCFEAGDIEALHQEYAHRGLEPPPPVKARAGNMLFSIHDPEGQLLEYTMYLPGSLHSVDRGKHLSERRVAERLIVASMTVKDVAAEQTFFTEKLGFEDVGGDNSKRRLRLPGKSEDEIELEAASVAKPHIAFAVADVERTATKLRARGLAVGQRDAELFITDPDGVMLIFRAAASRPDRGD